MAEKDESTCPPAKFAGPNASRELAINSLLKNTSRSFYRRFSNNDSVKLSISCPNLNAHEAWNEVHGLVGGENLFKFDLHEFDRSSNDSGNTFFSIENEVYEKDGKSDVEDREINSDAETARNFGEHVESCADQENKSQNQIEGDLRDGITVVDVSELLYQNNDIDDRHNLDNTLLESISGKGNELLNIERQLECDIDSSLEELINSMNYIIDDHEVIAETDEGIHCNKDIVWEEKCELGASQLNEDVNETFQTSKQEERQSSSFKTETSAICNVDTDMKNSGTTKNVDSSRGKDDSPKKYVVSSNTKPSSFTEILSNRSLSKATRTCAERTRDIILSIISSNLHQEAEFSKGVDDYPEKRFPASTTDVSNSYGDESVTEPANNVSLTRALRVENEEEINIVGLDIDGKSADKIEEKFSVYSSEVNGKVVPCVVIPSSYMVCVIPDRWDENLRPSSLICTDNHAARRSQECKRNLSLDPDRIDKLGLSESEEKSEVANCIDGNGELRRQALKTCSSERQEKDVCNESQLRKDFNVCGPVCQAKERSFEVYRDRRAVDDTDTSTEDIVRAFKKPVTCNEAECNSSLNSSNEHADSDKLKEIENAFGRMSLTSGETGRSLPGKPRIISSDTSTDNGYDLLRCVNDFLVERDVTPGKSTRMILATESPKWKEGGDTLEWLDVEADSFRNFAAGIYEFKDTTSVLDALPNDVGRSSSETKIAEFVGDRESTDSRETEEDSPFATEQKNEELQHILGIFANSVSPLQYVTSKNVNLTSPSCDEFNNFVERIDATIIAVSPKRRYSRSDAKTAKKVGTTKQSAKQQMRTKTASRSET